jgi:DNA-binding CsgD family transcriptional regulator
VAGFSSGCQQGQWTASFGIVFNAKTLSGFNNSFAAAVRCLGTTAFAMGRIPYAIGPGILFSVRRPGWIDHYAVNGFVRADIVIDETLRSLDPFIWSELPQRRPGQRARVFEECGRFGCPDGFTIPVQGPDGRRGLISLAAASSLSSLREVGRTELIRLAEAAYAEAWTLAKYKPGVPLGLSAREQRALLLVADGQDDAAIARIMSISTSTAHAHVERAKRRLGASTRAQAVAMAIRVQLI